MSRHRNAQYDDSYHAAAPAPWAMRAQPGMMTLFDGAGNAFQVHVGDGLAGRFSRRGKGRGRRHEHRHEHRREPRHEHHHESRGVLRDRNGVAAFAKVNGVEAAGRKRNEILPEIAQKRPITVNSERQFETILSFYITREGWADAKPMVIAQQILGGHAGDFAGTYDFSKVDQVRLLELIQDARRSAHAYKLRTERAVKVGPPKAAEATVAGTGAYGLQSLGRGY